MIHAALLCRVDATRESDRKRLRAQHLAYIAAHKDQILFGGPTLNAIGAPEMMILVIEASSMEEAEAFIQAEPYTAHGVFDHVDVRTWVKVLPEEHPGALNDALAAEQHVNS